MADPHPEFKRILVGLHHGTPGESIRCATEVASLLGLELVGVYVQEDTLIDLASLPFAREFRPLGGWRRIESEQLAHDFDVAARSAQRLFAQAVSGLTTSCQFEVVRGSMAQTIEAISRGGDIVIIGEPVSPCNHVSQQLAVLFEAALRCASAVLLVPRHVARRSGAVVAVAAEPNDPAIPAATAIADCAREDLVILESFGEADGSARPEAAPESQKSVRRILVTERELSHASGISSKFRDLHERLVVITRGTFADPLPSMIASVRHDPVLIIGTETDRPRGAGARPPD